MHVVQGACTSVDNENEVSFYSHHSKGDQASSTSARYNSGRDSILIVSTPKHVSVCVCIYARTNLRARLGTSSLSTSAGVRMCVRVRVWVGIYAYVVSSICTLDRTCRRIDQHLRSRYLLFLD